MASPSSSCCCLGLLLLLVLALAHVQAFAFAPALLPGGGVRGAAAAAAGSRSAVSGLRMGYVPDGMTKEQYAALRAKEEAAKPKNLGRVGTNRFKSRSFAAWREFFVLLLPRAIWGRLTLFVRSLPLLFSPRSRRGRGQALVSRGSPQGEDRRGRFEGCAIHAEGRCLG
jgi:hypothetical protein